MASEGLEPRKRELRQLSWAERRRIGTIARRGERAANARDAGLVASVAEESLRSGRLVLPLAAVVIIGLNATTIALDVARGRPVDWFLDVVPMVVVAALAAWHVFVHRPRLRRAKELNAPLADSR